MTYKLIVSDTTGIQIAPWFKTSGGIRVWNSIDLSCLEQQWITPLDGEKPHWRAGGEPDEIRDPAEVAVVVLQEVDRFQVDLRVSGNGLNLKLTDESNDTLNEKLVADGRTKFASYQFDYDTQEAVILDSTEEPGSLEELIDVGDQIGLPLD